MRSSDIEKGGWDENERRRTEKRENRTECDLNELTIYNEEKKKLMIDRIYACSLFFLNSLKKKKKRRKRQHIDFNLTSFFLSSLTIEYN